MSEAVETNTIEDLINHSLNQDYNRANQTFGNILGQKLDVALEQEKIKIANTVFNGVDPDEEEDETDGDQLEFDLESDDPDGTEEDGDFEDSETYDDDSETESDYEEEEV